MTTVSAAILNGEMALTKSRCKKRYLYRRLYSDRAQYRGEITVRYSVGSSASEGYKGLSVLGDDAIADPVLPNRQRQ